MKRRGRPVGTRASRIQKLASYRNAYKASLHNTGKKRLPLPKKFQ